MEAVWPVMERIPLLPNEDERTHRSHDGLSARATSDVAHTVTRQCPTRVRHVVLGMTVAAYMITYMDRVVISSAAPVIQKELGFSLITMGWILSSFNWGYALFQIPGGWLGRPDRPAPRAGSDRELVEHIHVPDCAGVERRFDGRDPVPVRHGRSRSVSHATRSLSRWLLPGERGFAQGVTHAGSRLGAAFTPPLVVLLIAHYSWRAAFLVFGGLGLMWAATWFWYYRDTPEEHRGVNAAERELIHTRFGRFTAARRRRRPLAADPRQ